jgi:hypothetical protein
MRSDPDHALRGSFVDYLQQTSLCSWMETSTRVINKEVIGVIAFEIEQKTKQIAKTVTAFIERSAVIAIHNVKDAFDSDPADGYRDTGDSHEGLLQSAEAFSIGALRAVVEVSDGSANVLWATGSRGTLLVRDELGAGYGRGSGEKPIRPYEASPASRTHPHMLAYYRGEVGHIHILPPLQDGLLEFLQRLTRNPRNDGPSAPLQHCRWQTPPSLKLFGTRKQSNLLVMLAKKRRPDITLKHT